ncbi:META domain-containing protein [Cryobacterium tagatosivorans]|uniref:META domain-containing protein n=1 Tax=Cryobacterium tagatosivorans TaxID=1259199 RepID=A0A4R8UEG2_9MICO|nr:META domain-containing protein [Cryobacterium tagatosivorans]TFB50296.1 META domain-containing protein [Cryobacterium tagatosivorans]
MRQRKRRRVLVLGALALAGAVLAGCATGAGPAEPPSSATAGPAPEDLVGTWVVDERFAVQLQPFLTIAADGTWAGSDGCNGVRGTWELGAGGAITTTAGPHTLIYCDGKDLPTLFADAKKVAVTGDTLVLLDAAGEVTVTLIAGREQLLKPQA